MSQIASRLGAIAFGIVVAALGLALLEGALRLAGVGGAAPVHDPFAGFSETVPTFEETVDDDGIAIHRVARTRANPRRAEAVLEDPQRRFPATKTENSFRVFVVGGSSAAGVPYGPQYAFSGWLKRLLDQALPERAIDVVNAAFSGYATRRALMVVQEIARYEPDLLIIYAGHNEFAERRFYANLLDLDPRLFELWESVASLRIYQLLSRLLPVPSPDADPPRLDFEADGSRAVQMFAVLDERTRGETAADPREDAYRDLHYEFNLRQMVEAMQRAGGRVMLLSLGQNLSDWAPASSSQDPGLSKSQRELFATHTTRADDAQAAGDCAAAIEAYEAALAVDASHAQTHFDLATCLRQLGRSELADEHFRAASDLDRAPHGAPSAFNDVVREVAEETGALYVDAEDALRVESGSALVGNDLFLDMVHPNIRAHQLIASEVAYTLRIAGVPEPSEAWHQTAPLPAPGSLYEEDPHLRVLEAQVLGIACQLARRLPCARAAADAIEALGTNR
jgi:lysophospholipase L1-like esterase